MKQLGYSKGYQYDHDAEGGVALGQTGFPDAMGERVYYEPVELGLRSSSRKSWTGCARRVPAPGTRAREPLVSIEYHPPGWISRCRWIRVHETRLLCSTRWL